MRTSKSLSMRDSRAYVPIHANFRIAILSGCTSEYRATSLFNRFHITASTIPSKVGAKTKLLSYPVYCMFTPWV